MVLSLLLLASVAVYAYRGWRRGLVVEGVELLGLIFAIVAATVTWPAIRGLTSGWTAMLTGIGVFAVVFFASLVVARSVGGHVRRLPDAALVLDGIGGSILATTWSVLLVTAVLLLGVTAPGARAALARPVCDSAVARGFISTANPLHGGAERVATLARPVLLWVSQQISDGLTLSHGSSLCENLPPVDAPPEQPNGTVYTFPPATESEISVAPGAEEEILALLNQARAEAGLNPVAHDPALRDVARAYSRQMYLEGFFAHTTPPCRTQGRDAPGCTDPFDRMRAAGIGFDVAGENLALAPTAERAHRGLMDSPGHRANILNPDYTHIGIGVYAGPFGLMVSQEFTG